MAEIITCGTNTSKQSGSNLSGDLKEALSDNSEHLYFPELIMNRLTWARAISAISCVPHP